MAALVATLGDSDNLVRKCAATSVLLLHRDTPVPADHESVASMHFALSDKEVAVRQAAVRSLWQAGAVAKQGDGVARVTAALTDADDFVRMYSARVIGKLGPDAGTAVPTLIDRLKNDENVDVRKLSAKALGLIGVAAVGKHMPEAVAAMKEGLKSRSPEFREYAARSLGQLDARDAADALRRLTLDPDPSVREAASEALKRFE
jgi:HEAT repeat protein